MTRKQRILASALLCGLIFPRGEKADAAGSKDWSERQHVYIEDCGKYENGRKRKRCDLVYYSLAYDDRIALELKNPHQAAAIPQKLQSDDVLKDLPACEPGKKELKFEYKPLVEDNLSIASYEVNGCTQPAQLLWLANKIAKRLGEVKLGGLIVRKSNDASLYMYLDEVAARLGDDKIPTPLSGLDKQLLELAQLELVGPDPFDPKRRFLLRTENPEELSLEREDLPDSNELSKARDPMLRTDFLACAARSEVSDWCRSRRQQYLQASGSDYEMEPASLSEECTKKKDAKEKFECQLAEAAQHFHNRKPISIVPTLIPISTKGPHAGFDEWLKSQKQMEDKFAGKVTLNSISNQSEERDNSTLSVEFEGRQGSYPGKLQLKVGAQVEFGNETVEEDVTRILATYERYFRPWVEAYGFVERFTNNFLSIEERWEGGLGMLLEYDVKRGSKDSFCYNAGKRYFGQGREIRVTRKVRQRLDQYQDKVRQQIFRQESISPDLQEEYCKYKRGIEKRNAFLQLGLAMSLFADFEEPDTLTVTALADEDDDNPATLDLTPPSTQVFRFTLRPTITVRPHERVTLEAWHYFKWDPSPDDDVFYGSKKDLRREWTVQAELRLSDGDPKVSLKGSITRYEDDRPPRLSAVDVFEQAVDGLTFVGDVPMVMDTSFMGRLTGNDTIVPRDLVTVEGFVAQRRHTVINGGLSINF